MFTIIQANNRFPNGKGNSGGGGALTGIEYPLNATFETLKVNKDATFTVNDKEMTFADCYSDAHEKLTNHETRIATLEKSKPSLPTDATFDTITVNKSATFTVNDEKITFANHESRIKTLEEKKDATSETLTDHESQIKALLAEIEALKQQIETLEGKDKSDIEEQLLKQVEELEAMCANIEPTIIKTGDLTLTDRIDVLESKVKNIDVDDETKGSTLAERLTIINRRCSNIA